MKPSLHSDAAWGLGEDYLKLVEECPNPDCQNGFVIGEDRLGRKTTDACPECRRVTEEDIKAMEGDRREREARGA